MPTENRSSNTEMISVPEGLMLVERSIWTEQQVEAATACITRLKGVPGIRDCDLAMAAIDAAQCKAPKISLVDLLRDHHQGEPVSCSHEWTDDGEFMLVCTACGAQENHDPKWRDMATAPRDGTLVRLLVEFTEHATEDSEAMPSPTIGANSFDHTGEDLWQLAGWSWEQDCFTQGEGEPVGWLPMLDTPHADPAEVERLRGWVSAYKESRERLHEWFREEQLKNISLRAQLDELVSAVRSINYGPAHAVRVPDDDEPCYPQRKEWIEWLFGLCDSASAEPSAPVDATHYYSEAESGRRWRKKVGGLWCEFCGGKWLPLDVQDMSHGYVAIEQSAPIELEALRLAREFIVNGVENGYIRMPDADTPDSAHDTLPKIEAALRGARA